MREITVPSHAYSGDSVIFKSPDAKRFPGVSPTSVHHHYVINNVKANVHFSYPVVILVDFSNKKIKKEQLKLDNVHIVAQ